MIDFGNASNGSLPNPEPEFRTLICAVGLSRGADKPTASVGTAFLVGDGRMALTAFHVVESILRDTSLQIWIGVGRDLQNPTPVFEWFKGELAKDLLTRDIDAALIRLSGAPECEVMRVFGDSANLMGPAQSFGYPPRGATSFTSIEPFPPATMTGVFYPIANIAHIRTTLDSQGAPSSLDEHRRWYKERIVPLLQGYSGAPLIRYLDNKVVGIVSHMRWSSALLLNNVTVNVLSMAAIRQQSPDLWEEIQSTRRPLDTQRTTAQGMSEEQRHAIVRLCQVTQWQVEVDPDVEVGMEELISGKCGEPKALSQCELWEALHRFSLARQMGSGVRIVSGPRGIGKTTVLSLLADRLATDYTSAGKGNAPVPLLMRLRRLKLDATKREQIRFAVSGNDLWQLLLDAWLSELAESGKFDHNGGPMERAFLEAALADRPMIVLMDGLDDLMANCQLEPARIRAMIRAVTRSGGRYARRFVITLRDTLRDNDLDIGYYSRGERLRLGVLSTGQKSEFLTPALFDRLCEATGYAKHDFPFYTPFELEPLKTLMTDDLELGPVISKAGLREYALRQSLGNVQGLHISGLQSAEEILDALTAIGFAAYRLRFARNGGWQSFDIEGVNRELAAMGPRWTPESIAELDTMSASLSALITNPDAVALVLNISGQRIFSPLADGRWQFSHGLWVDFVVGRFLALAIARNHLAALQETAFYSNAYACAGQLLQSMGTAGQLRASSLRAILDQLAAAKAANRLENIRRFEFGLGAVVLAYGVDLAMIEPEALKLLAERFADATPLSRHVIIGTFIARSVRNAVEDPSLAPIRDFLRSSIEATLDDSDANIATRSMAWMAAQALDMEVLTKGHPCPVPTTLDQLISIADLSNPAEDKGSDEGERRLNMLRAGYFDTVACSPERQFASIGATHYLLICVCIHRLGRGDDQFARWMGNLIKKPGSKNLGYRVRKDVRDAINSLAREKHLPELKNLLKHSEKLYAG